MVQDNILGGGWVIRLDDGRKVEIRAAKGGDEALIEAFIARLSATSRYQRFFMPLHGLSAAMLDHLVHGDPRCEAALLALTEDREVVGLVQYVGPQTLENAEVAVVVADAWRRIGLGAQLLRHLERVATAAGVGRVEADILRDNIAAIELAAKLGARIGKSPNGGALVRVVRPLVSIAETAGVGYGSVPAIQKNPPEKGSSKPGMRTFACRVVSLGSNPLGPGPLRG
jgi:GNAT superfamily N-acetyltransferase